MSTLEKGCILSPHPMTLTAYPTPSLDGTSIFFFHRNDRKGFKREYHNALLPKECYVISKRL